MRNEFDEKVKKIEQELLDLKTACEFVSTRSAAVQNSVPVNTGIYEIKYENPRSDYIATFIIADDPDNMALASLRTPSDSTTQLVEIAASDPDESRTGHVSIISNLPIVSFTKIG